MFIDSHCHLSFKDYSPEEREAILARAFEAGVGAFVNIGAGEGVESNDQAVEFAKSYPQVFATVGMHPHDAKLVTPEVLKHIEALAKNPKVVALGEVGLDFHYSHSPHDVQEKVLVQFLELAKKLDKPVVIHDRDAGDKTYELIRQASFSQRKVMIHCFTGDRALAKKYLDLGCLLSFTGIITFKNAEELREVVKLTPVESMLIETDSPYLAPIPFRGKKNEPAHVVTVAKAIAEQKGLSLSDVERITTLNATRFFNLPAAQIQASVVYAIRDSLYLNITNRCTLACTFCPKFIDYEVKGYYLKLPKEPTVEEVLSQVGDPSKYREVVFCGYGEPTRRLDALLIIAKNLKSRFPKLRIRINTDGLGNLVHQRNILPELAPFVDALSVSLNAQDAATYARVCPSKYKEAAYPAVKDFIGEAVKHIPEVVASVVGLPQVDPQACRKIAEEELGAKFRFRALDNVG
ncbi:MAG TPA: radical SAM protein [Deltaproteobacteria bacterium]|nr:MAG: hypothetical protein A2048_08635 [Deltaproteobacteria bacterium GWA2_45_12]HBF12408.1 radical SAM protein [Deltaproteobacteria bacterium]